MKKLGIDVSSHQGTIDWVKVKKDKIDFAIIRAGWSWYQGGLTIDEKFKFNIENAIHNGIDVGIYVYSYDLSAEGAKISAKNLLEIIKPYKIEYPIFFDMEYEKFNTTDGKGKINTDIVISFLDEIENGGYYSGLYCSTDFMNNYLQENRLLKYEKWIADYRKTCGYIGDYAMWQYSSKGKIDGISTKVDLNYVYTDFPKIIREKGLNNLEVDTKDEISKDDEKPSNCKKYYLWVGGFETTEGIEKMKLVSQFLKSVNIYNEIKSVE
ncbi:MAG: glycoside hydrolase family 25 protein [Oscillospiraceae bacterium]